MTLTWMSYEDQQAVMSSAMTLREAKAHAWWRQQMLKPLHAAYATDQITVEQLEDRVSDVLMR